MPYVETVMLTVQFAQDEIISNLVLPVSLRTRFPRPDFHGLTLLIRTTHHGQVWSWTFSSIISIKNVSKSVQGKVLGMVSPSKVKIKP